MTVEDALSSLEALGDPTVRERNARLGATTQFGLKMGDIRKLAKELKKQPDLAGPLWATGNVDAQLLAILLTKPKALAPDTVEQWVQEGDFPQVADWLNAYIVKKHPAKEDLRQRWMRASHPMLLRSAWSLTADRIAKRPEGLDLSALLDRIEAEMPTADPKAQWTMNTALAFVGIHHPEHRDRALALGEAMGIYRDYPTSKGCTSPFAPIWIAEMVRRQG